MANALDEPRKIRGLFTHRTQERTLEWISQMNITCGLLSRYHRPMNGWRGVSKPVSCMKITETEGYFTRTGGNDVPLDLINVLDML